RRAHRPRSPGPAPARSSPPAPGPPRPPPGPRQPAHSEATLAQTAEPVHFYTRGRGYDLFLTATEADTVLHPTPATPPTTSPTSGPAEAPTSDRVVIRTQFVGANPAAAASGFDRLPRASNYFRGDDPSHCYTNLAHYPPVRS